MGMSDRIEAFISELLKDESDWLELKRNELASVFGCAPSQINYVISTRFTPESGYAVESRRGGGGYLRIRRVSADEGFEGKVIKEIGQSVDYPTARAYVSYLQNVSAIDKRTADLMLAAVSDNSLIIKQPEKDKVRARILRNMLTSLI